MEDVEGSLVDDHHMGNLAVPVLWFGPQYITFSIWQAMPHPG